MFILVEILDRVKLSHKKANFTAGNYMFKVDNRNTRTSCVICSKLTIKIPERAIGVGLVSLLLTLNIFYNLF